MATFLAKIKVFEGRESSFEETISELFRETHANEPACRRYEYWRSAEPGTYYCMASFDDYVGFMIHQSSDHHEAPDFGSYIEDMSLEWIDPVDSGSPLGPTNEQALPADASDLMKQYAENMPVAVQSWWQSLRAK